MNTYLIVTIGVILALIIIRIIISVALKREDKRVKAMSPEEHRKYQEEMRKHQM